MKYWILTILLIATISEIISCPLEKKKPIELLDCINETAPCPCIRKHSLDKVALDKAYYLYLNGIYNCDSLAIHEVKSHYNQARKIWDTLNYQGFRVLSTYYDILEHYEKTEYSLDSIHKYTDLIFNSYNDKSAESIYYYHSAMISYLKSLHFSTDSYHYNRIISNYLNADIFELLNFTQKTEAYFYFVAAISNIQDKDFLARALNRISYIDSLYTIPTDQLSEYETLYASSLKDYIEYCKLHCYHLLGQTDKAIRGYKNHYNRAIINKDSSNAANISNSIAGAFIKEGKYDQALEWAKKAETFYKNQVKATLNYTYYLNLAEIYTKMNRPNLSDSLLNVGLQKTRHKNESIPENSINNEYAKPEYAMRYFTQLIKNEVHRRDRMNEDFDFNYTDSLAHSALELLQSTLNSHKNLLSSYNTRLITSELSELILQIYYNHNDVDKLFNISVKLKNMSINRRPILKDDILPEIPVLKFLEFNDSLYSILKRDEEYIKYNICSIAQIKEKQAHVINSIVSLDKNYQDVLVSISEVIFSESLKKECQISIMPSEHTFSMPLDLIFNEYSDCKKTQVKIGSMINTDKSMNYQQSGSVFMYADTFKYSKSANTNEQLPFLKSTKLEFESIADLYSSLEFNNPPDELPLILKNKGIFHFAGHYLLDPIFPEESKLVFRNKNQIEFVTIWEMMNWEINKSICIINACQSTLGKILPYEGNFGLTEVLFSAGAKSVVSTLWPINDASSAYIMTEFHRELKKGKRKDAALRNAKLKYLEQADPEYQHPYYWAGFIAMGDMSPIFDPYANLKKYGLIGGGILVLLFGYKKTRGLKMAA